MNRSRLAAALVTAAAAAIALPAILSAEPPAKPAADAQPSEAEMMEMWVKMNSPGEHHKHLQAMAGEWDAQAKFWMDPAAPPTETKGRTRNTMIFDGRFIKSEYTGEWQPGMPFSGNGLIGYNNVSKQYESTWIDSLSTAIMFSTGTCDSAGKFFTFTGTYDCCLTNQKVKSKHTTRIVDANKHVFTMFRILEDGTEQKEGEITYTRRMN